MSYTEIYKFKKDGHAEFLDEVKNAFRGAMAIWIIVEKRYLPKYTPDWASIFDDSTRDFSRTSDFRGDKIQEIWDLHTNSKVSEIDKIVLGSTFDNVVVMKKDIPRLIEAFRSFEGETSLKEQAVIIEDAFKNDKDLIAIAWNQTSVNGDAWESDDLGVDDEGEEYYLPYSVLTGTKHWDLFEVESV